MTLSGQMAVCSVQLMSTSWTCLNGDSWGTCLHLTCPLSEGTGLRCQDRGSLLR